MSFPTVGVVPVPIHPDGRRAAISQPYGPRDDGTIHPGVDVLYRRRVGEPAQAGDSPGRWFLPGGVPALAPGAGVVTDSEEMRHPDGYSRGWGVRIDHGGGWASFVNHIVIGTQRVRVGQRVEIAEVLGEIGGSNDGRGIKHVHLGLWKNGQRVDPGPHVAQWQHVQLESGVFGSVALGLVVALVVAS